MGFRKYTSEPPLKYVGRHPSVVQQLGLTNISSAMSKEDFDKQMQLDKDRMRIVSLTRSFKEYQNDLIKSPLWNDRTKRLRNSSKQLDYTQGDYFAGALGKLMLQRVPGFQKALWEQRLADEAYILDMKEYPAAKLLAEQNSLPIPPKPVAPIKGIDEFGIAYEDDQGKPCGISFWYSVDPLRPGKAIFNVNIIRNTNLSPEDREVIFISHEDLLKNISNKLGMGEEILDGPDFYKSPQAGEPIDDKDIVREITEAVDSASITRILIDLITGNSISLKKIEELKVRCEPKKNIDDRDVKLDILLEQAILSAQLQLKLEKNKTDPSVEEAYLLNTLKKDLAVAPGDFEYLKRHTEAALHEKLFVLKTDNAHLLTGLPELLEEEKSEIKEHMRKTLTTYNQHSIAAESKFNKDILANFDSDLEKKHNQPSQLIRNLLNYSIMGGGALVALGAAVVGALVFLGPLGLLIAGGAAAAIAVIVLTSVAALLCGVIMALAKRSINHDEKALGDYISRKTIFENEKNTKLEHVKGTYEETLTEKVQIIEQDLKGRNAWDVDWNGATAPAAAASPSNRSGRLLNSNAAYALQAVAGEAPSPVAHILSNPGASQDAHPESSPPAPLRPELIEEEEEEQLPSSAEGPP